MSELPTVSFNLETLEDAKFGARGEKIPDGISAWRILPPYGTKHGGSLCHAYQLHWGFVGANGKVRPIACSYPTEGYCPVCTRVFEMMDELKRAEANKDEKLIEECNAFLKAHRVRKTFVYNVVTADGRVSYLPVGKTVHDGLKAKISEAVYKKGFDPTALEGGVWFEIDRSGKGFNTEYKVDFKRKSENVGGEIVERLDRSPIAPSIVADIRAQLAGGSGSMSDVHVQHDATTSAELKALMSGGIVQSKRPAREEKAPVLEQKQAPAQASAPAPVSHTDLKAEIERVRNLKAAGATKEG